VRFITADGLAIDTIGQEAAMEPWEGQVAVGGVIRNRMRALHYWSDGTVEGTVLKPYQFSGWNTTMANRVASVRLDSSSVIGAQIARAWTESATRDPSKGALLYFNPKIVAKPPWVASAILVAKIGGHQFYVPKLKADAREIARLAAHVGRHLSNLRLAYDSHVALLGHARAAEIEPDACCSRHRAV
jgi:hypothetical protein